jgi:hypothetical protein
MLDNIIPDAVNFCSANSSFKAEKEGKKGYFCEEKTYMILIHISLLASWKYSGLKEPP